ncbi:MAG: Calx-beta domain-containing protein, partial [Pirellulaceae bacterium]
MRLTWTSWENTLRRLGLAKRKRLQPRHDFRRPLLEQLEIRDLLATVITVDAIQDGYERGPVPVKFLIIAARDPSGAVSQVGVNFSLSGTATPGADYTPPTSYFVTFQSGNSFPIDLSVISDYPYPGSNPEPTETVVLTITSVFVTMSASPGATAQIGTPRRDTAYIYDDVGPVIPLVKLRADDPNAHEQNSDDGSFLLTATPPPLTDLAVSVTIGGTATLGADYAQIGTFTILAHRSSARITIDPVDDRVYEPGGETVTATLNTGAGYTRDTVSNYGVVTIADNDQQPKVSISNAGALEGTNLVFYVTRLGGTNQTVTMNYATRDGSARVVDADYTAGSGSISIPASSGNATQTISVPALTDAVVESTENMFVDLSNLVNATFQYSSGRGNIVDVVVPELFIGDVTVREGDLTIPYPDTQARFPVSLSQSSSLTITVDYTTADGTAVVVEDYGTPTGTYANHVSGTLTFSPGQTLKYIDVPIRDDDVIEPTEVFYVRLSHPTNVKANDLEAVGTILDNDLPESSDTSLCDCECSCSEVTLSANANDGSVQGVSKSTGLKASSRSVGATPVALDVQLSPTAASATSIETKFTFNGQTTSSVYYSGTGYSPTETYRFATVLDTSGVTEGRYKVELTVIESYTGGGTVTRKHQVYPVIRNRIGSEFGAGWSPVEVDRLRIQTGGIVWARGDHNLFYFRQDSVNPDIFLRPKGEFDFSTLTRATVLGNYEYTLRKKTGEKLIFNQFGVMQKRIDRNGNTTNYSYEDKNGDEVVAELRYITDPVGRLTTYNYTGPRVTSILTPDGETTLLGYDASNRLVTISQPDADGPGPDTRQMTTLGYDGTSNRLSSVTNPLGETTTAVYNSGTKMALSITHPDTGVETYTVELADGLVLPGGPVGSFLNPAVLKKKTEVKATYTNEVGAMWQLSSDRFGHKVNVTDPNGQVFTYARDDDGLVLEEKTPRPSFAEWHYFTTYDYDDKGNLISLVTPDLVTHTWTYEANFSQPTSHVISTPNYSHIFTYTVSSTNGNITAVNDAGILYGFTYTPLLGVGSPPAGLIATYTDPRTFVTSFGYDSHGNTTSVTSAVGTVDEAAIGMAYNADDLLWTYTDELGKPTTYLYDNLGRMTTMMLPDPDGAAGPLGIPVYQYAYSRKDMLKKETDPLGRITEYAHTSRDDVDWVKHFANASDPSPVTMDYTYDVHRRLTHEFDPLGRLTSYGYDLLDNLTSTTLPSPGAGLTPVYTTAYDTISRPKFAEDPLGNGTKIKYRIVGEYDWETFAFQGAHREVEVRLPNPTGPGVLPNYDQKVNFDKEGNVAETWDARGAYAGYLREAGRPPYLVAQTASGYSGLKKDWFSHDASGNLLYAHDTYHYGSSYVYDARDRLKTVNGQDPDGTGQLVGSVTAYAYDDASQLTSLTDPLGFVTSYTYDNAGHLASVTEPDPDGAGPLASPVTAYKYDIVGRLISVTDPRGNITSYTWDPHDNLATVTTPDPDGAGPLPALVTTYAYNAAGEVTSVTLPDPDGAGPLTSQVTSYTYNGQGKVAAITQPDPDGAGSLAAPVTAFTYDIMGRLATFTDPTGSVTTYAYDNRSRLISVTHPDPDGAGALTAPITSYEYNLYGDLTKVTLPGSRSTSYAYNGFSELLSMTEPDPDGAGSLTSPVTQYGYNAEGIPISVTDPLGHVTAFAHDRLWRLTTLTEADPDGAGSLTSPVSSFVYNVASQLTSQTDPLSRVTSFGYDGLGRQTSVTQPDPDGAGPLTAPVTSYAYDTASNLTSVTDPLNHATTYVYDALNRRTSITDANSGVTSFAFDALGNLKSLTDPRSNVTTWGYDNLNRAVSENNQFNFTRTFAYNSAGDLTSKLDRNGRKTTYEYDALHRQTAEKWRDGSNNVIRTISSTFDNSLDLTGVSDPAATYTYVYDNLGRVTQQTQEIAGLTPDIILAQQFDAASNRTKLSATIGENPDFVNDYIYDNLNRLTSVTQQSGPGGEMGMPPYANAVAEKRVDFSYFADGQFNTITRYADLTVNERVAVQKHDYDGIGRLKRLVHSTDA